MSLFKANYGYKLKILLILRQAKKINKSAKKRIKKLIQLHRNLYKLIKLVQDCIKRYYNQKVFKRLDFKKGDKVYLLTKIFKSDLVRN